MMRRGCRPGVAVRAVARPCRGPLAAVAAGPATLRAAPLAAAWCQRRWFFFNDSLGQRPVPGSKDHENYVGMTPGQRLEYTAQLFAGTYLNHTYFGFFARVATLLAVLGTACVLLWRSYQWSLENQPLAHRWLGGWHEITFLERIEQPGSNVAVYRFALPHSYDTLGYTPITSVLLRKDMSTSLVSSCHRWYNPISHPDQRGVVEFAIKLHPTGVFTAGTLMTLEPGQKLYMGGFKQEFDYAANKYDEIGFIAGNSGITPMLQMLTVALTDKDDKTKFSLLYTNRAPSSIPFRRRLEQLQREHPDRFKVTFVCQSEVKGCHEAPMPMATRRLTEEGMGIPLSTVKLKVPAPGEVNRINQRNPGAPMMAYDDTDRDTPFVATGVKSGDPSFDGYVQIVDRNLVLETMPPPGMPRTKIFVCLNEHHLPGIAGRAQNMWLFGFTKPYWQAPAGGILGEMGYTWGQLHKFGYSSIPAWQNKDNIVTG